MTKMKYLLELGNDRKLLLTEQQLAAVVDAVDGAPMLDNKHVGDGKGTHGYNSCYIYDIALKRAHEWMTVRPISDYLEALKLAVKLHDKDE
jgi:hypothetical protein